MIDRTLYADRGGENQGFYHPALSFDGGYRYV
jgi:hypothetical protein